MYIDTHAHLDFPELKPRLDAVLSNARLAGVDTIITIGIDGASNQAALEIARTHANVYAALGWHPHDASKANSSLEDHIKGLADNARVVAIGEIGLDYFRDYSPRESQREVFRRMIAVAGRLDLPIIIHCRNAFTDVLDILQREKRERTRGVFHCFSGNVEELYQVLDLGFFVSYTGNITYRNSKLSPTIQATPSERILLETDCPFLTPHPHRGKPNEPAYLPLIAARIAGVKGIAVGEVARITSENARHLFALDRASK